MTDEIREMSIDDVLTRAYAIDIPPRSRTFIDRRIGEAMALTAAKSAVRRRPRLRRPLAFAIGLLVVSGLVTAVGAAGHFIRLEWGSLPDQQRTPAQINAEIRAVMKTTPIPPGYTFPSLRVPEDDSVWGSYSGQSMVEFNAICAWYGDWLMALKNGDSRRLSRDRAMFDQILTWKTISDPNLADESVRELFRGLNAAADSGDTTPITAFRTGGSCPAP
jgi:hypothetical protein